MVKSQSTVEEWFTKHYRCYGVLHPVCSLLC